jgi:acylphosphatase
MIRVRVAVDGRVQGVWYRQSCQREAEAQGVTGWVRNNEDGTVEAVLEGEPEAVSRVLEWMRHGPPHAVVTRVVTHQEVPRHERGFVIR